MIDLGAGHSSGSETLCGRIVAALKAEALLNESVGAGYIDRNWPPAFKESGAWPLASLRQSFLNGALTRLLDPDRVLRGKVAEFVEQGDFGLASGPKADGGYEHLWYQQLCPADEVSFEAGVLLLKKERAAKALKSAAKGTEEMPKPDSESPTPKPTGGADESQPDDRQGDVPAPTAVPVCVSGTLPSEVWNRFGQRVIPKLRAGEGVTIEVRLSATFDGRAAADTRSELRQSLDDLGLEDAFKIE